MPRSKFQGPVQERPKLISFTLLTDTNDNLDFVNVKAVDAVGAKALINTPDTKVVAVLKGHVTIVG